MIILLVVAFVLIAVLQGKNLIKRKKWKDLVVFSLFLIIGFIMCILKALGVSIADPIESIKKFIDNVYGIF